MILVLDNRDSFTFNLVQALRTLGAAVEVRRADASTVGDVPDLGQRGHWYRLRFEQAQVRVELHDAQAGFPL